MMPVLTILHQFYLYFSCLCFHTHITDCDISEGNVPLHLDGYLHPRNYSESITEKQIIQENVLSSFLGFIWCFPHL